MHRFYVNCFLIIVFFFFSYFSPALALEQNSRESGSAFASSEWVRQESSRSGNPDDGAVSRTAPAGGTSTNAISALPIGSGFSVLVTLSVCYLSYVVFFRSKKEKKE